jgi:hypothetical protein
MAMAFDVKKLLDQLDKDPVPVKCGDVFDVIVWVEIIPRLGCEGGPTDEEEREMYRALQEEWLSAAQKVCNRAGASCPKPQQAGGKLLENVCAKVGEIDIWRIKTLIKTKCTA